MSALSAGRASKTICRPSGDQRGEPANPLWKAVNWTGCSPVLSATQICEMPERFEAKAIRLPSGERSGLASRRVEAIKGFRDGTDWGDWLRSLSSICQMFRSQMFMS